MPIEISYTGSGIYRKFSGHIDFVDVFQANGEVWSHPEWDGFVYMIDDLRDISTASFSRNDADVTGRMHIPAGATNSGLMVAAVCTNPRILSLLEVFDPLLKKAGWEFRVCATPDEAFEWVGSGRHGRNATRT